MADPAKKTDDDKRKAVVEARERLASHSAVRKRTEQIDAAERLLLDARMVGAEVQSQTIAERDVIVVDTDHKAIVVGKDGEEKVADKASSVLALFDRSSCAVLRLARDGLIEEPGLKAALAFAAAGDRVMGGVRVRTVRFDTVKGGGEDGASDAERNKLARWRWDLARISLSRAQFLILDRVMRHDETSVKAAGSAYPNYSCRKKLSGMGDQALIDACEALAVDYGFESKKTDHRSLSLIGIE